MEQDWTRIGVCYTFIAIQAPPTIGTPRVGCRGKSQRLGVGVGFYIVRVSMDSL